MLPSLHSSTYGAAAVPLPPLPPQPLPLPLPHDEPGLRACGLQQMMAASRWACLACATMESWHFQRCVQPRLLLWLSIRSTLPLSHPPTPPIIHPPANPQPYQLDPNVWTHKPAWCQPWSIVGTGGAVVAGVWALSAGSTGWTAAAALPVAAWWWLFLGVYPQQFRDYAEGLNAQQRQQQLEEQRRRQQAE